MENHKIFELALVAKAVSMQKKFDLLHLSIGNGELILPFLPYLKRPVLITMHGSLYEKSVQKYMTIFPKMSSNPFFVSISNAQRKPIPSLNYIKTIYHGVNIDSMFTFEPMGGDTIMWAGRAIPDKGLDTVLAVVKRTKRKAKVLPIIKEEYIEWLKHEIIKKRNIINETTKVFIDFDINRWELPYHYQTSRVFLFPLIWEEPFGFTLVESMACGTPVVAYARGSVPEIVRDGITGFLVNPSNTDIRGNWIIKKTGFEGLCEGINRIYAMSNEKYAEMRRSCRSHAEENFSVNGMIQNYIEVYKEAIKKYKEHRSSKK
jgi:glycosyltransferase involved in cell wall biosynthesis